MLNRSCSSYNSLILAPAATAEIYHCDGGVGGGMKWGRKGGSFLFHCEKRCLTNVDVLV